MKLFRNPIAGIMTPFLLTKCGFKYPIKVAIEMFPNYEQVWSSRILEDDSCQNHTRPLAAPVSVPADGMKKQWESGVRCLSSVRRQTTCCWLLPLWTQEMIWLVPSKLSSMQLNFSKTTAVQTWVSFMLWNWNLSRCQNYTYISNAKRTSSNWTCNSCSSNNTAAKT